GTAGRGAVLGGFQAGGQGLLPACVSSPVCRRLASHASLRILEQGAQPLNTRVQPFRSPFAASQPPRPPPPADCSGQGRSSTRNDREGVDLAGQPRIQ